MKLKFYLFTLFFSLVLMDGIAQSVIRGPYIQMNTPNSIIIRWRTNSATDSKVWYGSSYLNLASISSLGGNRTEHEVQITGLTPNTTYYYAIGNSGGQLAGADPDHFFKTSPPHGTSQPVSIWVLGDAGKISVEQRAVRDGFYTYNGGPSVDLILLLGDNAYDDGTDEEFQGAWFENMYESTLINSPIWPSIGNHDVISADSERETGPYYDIFNMPRNGEAGGVPSGTEAWYSFDYANIHFIVLNTEDVDHSASSPMLAWLEQDIAATNQEWIVAYFHKQPYYTVGEFRENFVPVLEEGGVDLVMYGHRHIYRRSFLMNGHYDGAGSFDFNTMAIDQGDGRIDGDGAYEKPPGKTPNNGTIYLVSGSAGSASLINTNYPFVVHEYGRPNYGSTHVSVNGGQMDVRFVDTQGEVLDYFTISKGVGNRPTVNITSPADGTEYLQPQSITITAETSDPDGQVTRVEFFANGASIGVDQSAPFSLNWNIPDDGLYTLEAVATDSDGNIAQSAPITIQVGIFEVCTSVASSSDDAEQVTAGGGMKLTSSDLEIGQDATEQIIGLRFQGLSIPKNAQIISAEIKFVVDKTTSLDPCEFSIQGIASPNPSTFSSTSYDLANRPRTLASAAWTPNEWGTVGAIQSTTDIKSIVQELVNQDAYAAGNALGFLIEGTGKRTAASFNGNPANAPQFCVVYTINDTGFECAAAGADIGMPCDDGDPCTVDDVIQPDCSCAGTPTDDSDNDGTCDLQDICNGGLEPGTPCDDGNSNTYDDEIDENCNCIGINIPYEGAVTAMVDDESDDAEEEISNGSVSLTSSDLELGYEPQLVPIAQLVGVRFTNIGIPQGAHITNAYIQFTLDELSTGTAELLILGEDVDDAQIFTNDAYNLSDRSRTSASASWNPGSWDDGEVDGPDQRTVNIANIVQEIVNRPGWQPQNSMAFLVSGTGTRTAASYDGSGAAPVLHIEYDNTSDCPAPGTPCNDGDDCTVNDVFDADCNCVGTFRDEDSDGICDDYDICPLGDDLVDTDGDLTPDACDSCPNSATGDSDGDGVCDDVDVCEYGDDTLDADGDGMPDECDVCPESATDDSDNDGICDNLDVCVGGDDNLDNDNDGVPNACDVCPDWTGNMDSDGDGVCDNLDVCPNGDDTVDSDADGTPDDCDACPNSATGDTDGDGVCDDLDACPGSDDNLDEDGDGIPDACDPCDNDLIGQLCDDGDPFTINDKIDANCNCTGISTIPEVLEVNITNGSDDVEEREGTGAMYFTSSDLELVNDGARGNQTIGLRFNNISIPRGSVVEEAYVQFTTDEISLGPVSLTIQGQATNDAPPFADASFDISTRARTSTAVSWSPPDWNLTGQAGAGQRTLDISPIIQELINRPGWTAGNSIALMITGTGTRTATAYEGSSFDGNGTALNAPKLHIEYYEAGNCPSFGQPCDDGDPCTANDTYDEFCGCIGESLDADGDGVCDLDDVCPDGDDTVDTDGDGLPNACDDCPNSATGDTDGDGVCDDLDLCPGSDDNVDADADGVPDACDICAGGDDAIDSDGDGTPDFCDACPNSATGDTDGDGVCDDVDICANGDDNIDSDGDGTPDFCDACPNSATGDTDGDGVCDDVDICAGGDDAIDSDGDGTPDFCDACPNSATGDTDGDGVCDDVDICDGGDDLADADGDGTPDFCDECPNSATGDSDGDGVCDDLDLCAGGDDALDADNDGVPDFCDVCPNADDALDADGDGIPDACDSCPNSATGDTDGDGVCDDVDICPAGDDSLDTDGDGTPNACDSCPDSVSPDTDGDGVCDDFDICIGGDDNVDSDGDGTPDFCDDCPNSATGDTDGDGVCDDADACPGSDDSIDADDDGIPDACDSCPNSPTGDSDGDGVCDDVDICDGGDDLADADDDGTPDFCDACPNSATGDTDGDSVCDDVDVCPDGDDTVDSDGDGVPDFCDACPNSATGDSDGDGVCDDLDICAGGDDSIDSDGDGTPDFCDACPDSTTGDTDGDGVCDAVDVCPGGDDTVDTDNDGMPDACDTCPNSATDDSDGDGICDDVDICAGGDDSVDSDGDGVPDFCDACAGADDSLDADSDGVPDACDACPNSATGDTDGDGVCDDVDICPNGDDAADLDGDGTPDACDPCNDNLIGTACDDGDPNTINDVLDANCECAGAPTDPNVLEISLENGDDDAEETVSSGVVDLFSSDLELIHDASGGGDQVVGIRFNNLTIPKGGVVENAYIQFVADKTDEGPTSLLIEGQSVTNAPAFTGVMHDLSSRSRTAASVNWVPVPWTLVGERGELQRTANIAPILQELITRDDWQSGNSVVILITGSGKRAARSYEGGLGQGPSLHVEYFEVGCNLTGLPCDDGDPCTVDDKYNVLCDCVGVFQDSDGDGVCDEEDICPAGDDHLDTDADGTPDACDACPNSAAGDTDGDGVCDDVDLCPGEDDLADADADGTPDACDTCPNSATDDSDGDGICDDQDICLNGDDTIDSDSDGLPDACDPCPDSPANDDADNDGVCDGIDICPGGDDNVDSDGDGAPDACDNCPNSATGDSDGDGVCDDQDQCPGNDDTLDGDGDGIPDACDDCDGNLIGTSCDDGDPNTVNDILDGNCNCAGRPTEPTTLEIPLASGNDDAEEDAASGVVDLTSSDLELIFDRSSGAQVVGIRFNNVALPRGGVVEDAYIQFTADKTDDELVEMTITGQAIADAPAFTGVNSDLSGRSSTAAAVDWTPMAWTLAGERGALQRTPNIGPILQELISREDWQSGNSIAILIRGAGGRRAAISYEGGLGQGPSLHIEYFDSNCNLTGQSCDDGDPCTTGDVYDSFCNCAGTLQDSDSDGICDAEDVCANGDDTLDADGDGTPDACDTCPNSATGDTDGDGVCDDLDVCPGQDDLADADGDGTPDACDSCPNSATDDSDGDGICDDLDICLNGDDTIDSDSDGLPDACDPCPDSPANDDADNDGVCDGIDICPGGDDNVDSDGDGVPDACDSCPNSATGDSDGDGVCDDIDACPGSDDSIDSDLDGVPDGCDICENGDDTVDSDNDGTPDACDSCPNSATGDSDGDGVCDDLDICPNGDDSLDSDADGTPDACDSCDNNLIGTACDDGNPNTVNDVYDANCNCSGTSTTPNVLDVLVATGNDDAEEAVATGVVDLGSSDLEIVDDGGIQTIGIRFDNVNLPQGAAIEQAYVQFTADKTKDGALTVTIEGQASDDPPVFTATPYNVSSRTRTTASVSWSPPDWNVLGERGPGQQTADIAPIIQELVGRPGWSPGNAIVIIISGDNASFKRTATSYDSGAGLGRQPGLHVEYFDSNCSMTGQSCDDGNPCTTGDVYDALCNCAGTLADSDGDGVCNSEDVCPGGDDTIDTDNDGTPDACDSCPNSATGDTDGDGVCDDVDQCPGEDDAADADADGTPDACDVCPNSATDDSDGDGICDDQDICLNGDDTIDSDSDGLPDACDPCPDSPANDDADNDGVCDGIDICPGGDDNVDSDGDGTPDACDSCPNSATGDSDGDGVCDDADLCPGYDDAVDSDGDFIPDGCDDCDNSLTGTPCDDGDPNTTDDVYDANCNCAGTPPTTTQSLDVRVTAGNDDAEEHETSGDVSLTSSDLELANDGARGNQTIGIRFNDVFVPNNAPVTRAYIQFTADKSSSTAAVLTIHGEAADNAAVFTTALYNVSQRPTTTASETWTPPAWNLPGEAGTAQRTVDISSIIEEIVSRPGWTAGNSIAIIITGVEKRTAVSYDGAAASGPVLHVEWLGDGSACPDAGTPCDDGDPATENDVEDGSCGCAGTPCPEAGTACDDGDPNTTLDTEDGNCNCVGIPCEPAGTVCDDGDPCTVNDVFDADCNCAGVYQDSDNDGYCVGDDPDDNNPCIPDNSMEGCDPCDVIADVDFESGSGVWNSGGSDAYLGTLFAQSGATSMVIQDNSGAASSMYTNDLDLTGYSTVTIEFSYYPFSMDNANEDFWLQISTDGGATYTQIEEWNLFDEFVNDSWHYDIVAISGITFTPNTRLRFMCDASANGDQIHIDDVRIMGCTNAGTSARIIDLGNAGDGTAAPFSGNNSVLGQAAESLFGVELLVTARPNPFQNELKLFIESSQTELREARIQVMDINGKLIYQQEHVPLGEDYLLPQQDNWQSGVYFVRVQAGQGVRMLKLVKQ